MKRSWCLLVGLPLFFGPATACRAGGDDYRGLLRRLPDSTTAIVLVDVKGLRQTLGVTPGTALQESRLASIPVMAGKFVLGARVDLSGHRHQWSVAVMRLDGKMSMQDLAKTENEPVQELGGHPAVLSPRNAYFVELGPGLLATATPADRQMVARWLRFQDTNQLDTLSPYLIQAANAAGPAVMTLAIDLENAVDPAAVQKGLSQSQVLSALQTVDYAATARVITQAQGAKLTVAPGSPLAAELTVDFNADTGPLAAFAKPLLLESLQNAGVYIPDFDDWEARLKDRSLTLRGPLSVNGLRRLGTLVRTPAPAPAAANLEARQAAAPAARALAASQAYFLSVTQTLDDLKLHKAVVLNSRSNWYDQAANQINNLPTLDVDPRLIGYGTGTAQQLQEIGAVVANLKSNIQRVRASSYPGYTGVWLYNDSRAGGAVPTKEEYRLLIQQATAARAKIWEGIDAVTDKIRDQMTAQFNTQF